MPVKLTEPFVTADIKHKADSLSFMMLDELPKELSVSDVFKDALGWFEMGHSFNLKYDPVYVNFLPG